MIDPIYSRIENTPRPTLTAASGFVCLAAVGLWASMLAGSALGTSDMALLNALYYLPFVGLPLLIYGRARRGLGAALRLNPPPELPLIGVTLLALLSVYAASGLSAIWGRGLDALGLSMPGSVPMPQTRREAALAILTMAAFPAIFEELLFRGFVLSAWESRGTAFAIGVSAALFALLHSNLYGLPAYLLVGAVSGLVTFATDSVYTGIVYHTVYNAAAILISYLLSGQEAAEGAVTPAALLSMALTALFALALMALLLTSLLRRAQSAGIEAIPRIRRPLSDRERVALLAAVLLMLASIAVVQVLANG